jgi:hypothetical protein
VSFRRHVLFLVAIDTITRQELVGADRLLAVGHGTVAVATGTDLLVFVDAPEDALVRCVDVVLRYLCSQVVVTGQTERIGILVRTGIGDQTLMGRIDVLCGTDAAMTGHTAQTSVEARRAVLIQENALKGWFLGAGVLQSDLTEMALGASV